MSRKGLELNSQTDQIRSSFFLQFDSVLTVDIWSQFLPVDWICYLVHQTSAAGDSRNANQEQAAATQAAVLRKKRSLFLETTQSHVQKGGIQNREYWIYGCRTATPIGTAVLVFVLRYDQSKSAPLFRTKVPQRRCSFISLEDLVPHFVLENGLIWRQRMKSVL